MTVAVQTAVGNIGKKAATFLSYKFASMCNLGDMQFGGNSDGLYLLNTGEQDDGVKYARSFTLATSDYGAKNIKRLLFVYIGIECTEQFVVSVKADDQVWRSYTISPAKAGGIQTIRVPIGRDGQGRYWTVDISSIGRFRVDQIEGMFLVRPLGVKGY